MQGKLARRVWEGAEEKGLQGTSSAAYFTRRGEVRKGLIYDTTCGDTKRVDLDENSTSLAPYPTFSRLPISSFARFLPSSLSNCDLGGSSMLV